MHGDRERCRPSSYQHCVSSLNQARLRTEEKALHPRPAARRVFAAGIALVTGPTALTACQRADAASALGRIEKAGRVEIATDALYPPNEFKQGERIVGFDVDLGTAIARKLGVQAEFQDVKFDTILQAMQEGKYDISLSSFTDTKQREASVDFVTYLSVGTALLVRKGDPKRLRPDDLSLCGARIAVEKGTTQEAELMRRSVSNPTAGARIDACKQGHRRAPIRMSFDDQDAANRALAKGYADAALTDMPSATYGTAQTGGRFEVVGPAYGEAPYGIALPKNQTGLRDAVLKAMKDLIADGSYRKIVARWGLTGGAITEPQVNVGR